MHGLFEDRIIQTNQIDRIFVNWTAIQFAQSLKSEMPTNNATKDVGTPFFQRQTIWYPYESK